MTDKPSAPTVSVILCTCNRPAAVVQVAVDSILNQSYSDLELLIVNDGGKDPELRRLTERYARRDKRVGSIHLSENLGLAAARNRAIEQARGSYIALQDDDDISLPNRLEIQLAFLRRHPEISSVLCRCDTVSSDLAAADTAAKGEVRIQPPNTRLKTRRDFVQCLLVNASVLIRRQALLAVNGYRNCLRIHEDLDLSLRLQERFTMAMLPQVLYQQRRHSLPQLTGRTERWAYYCVIITCAWLRRTGQRDPLEQNPDTSLSALFPVTELAPGWLRRIFIWHARKTLKLAVRKNNQRESAVILRQCSRLAQGLPGKLVLGRLQLRVFLWSAWYRRPAGDAQH